MSSLAKAPFPNEEIRLLDNCLQKSSLSQSVQWYDLDAQGYQATKACESRVVDGCDEISTHVSVQKLG